jgi:hypothetical protein
MTPKGNSCANGISERESNSEANCEADCNIARHNLAGALSAGGDGGRKSPEHHSSAIRIEGDVRETSAARPTTLEPQKLNRQNVADSKK